MNRDKDWDGRPLYYDRQGQPMTLQQWAQMCKDENYTQEGIYVSFAPRLDDPSLWSAPQKILNGGRWYPQVIGSTPNLGTDKIAAASPRFFMFGKSEWIITFAK